MYNTSYKFLKFVLQNNVQRVRQLLHLGVDVNVTNAEQRSALILACINKTENMIEFLLQQNIDLSINDVYGNSVVHYCSDLHFSIIHKLITAGMQLDVQNKFGQTALMLSTNLDFCRILLTAGVDIDQKDFRGKTALMYMCVYDYDITKLLLQHNACVNSQDNSGKTPLMYCNTTYLEDICQLLIHFGADVSIKDSSGKNALMYSQNCQISQILLHNDCLIDDTDFSGKTALMYSQKQSITLLLLSYGANIDLCDHSGKNALLHSPDLGITEILLKQSTPSLVQTMPFISLYSSSLQFNSLCPIQQQNPSASFWEKRNLVPSTAPKRLKNHIQTY